MDKRRKDLLLGCYSQLWTTEVYWLGKVTKSVL